MGQHLVILSSAEAVEDLLLKRGAIYSDRPTLAMQQLSGWEYAYATLRYGERFRATRRLSGRVMNSRASRDYIPMQEQAMRRLLKMLLVTPERFEHHIKSAAGSIVLKLAYDYDTVDDHDPLVDLADRALEIFSVSSKPHWAVNLFPALRYLPHWFPGCGFLGQAAIWKKVVREMYKRPFEMAKKNMQTESGHDSMIAKMLEGDGESPSPDLEELVMLCVGSLYGGVSQTVSAGLSFLLAMTLYPDVQHRAQAEIEAITGGDRLPTYNDRERMPYVDALIQEVHRWNPVLPCGLPHFCSTEDVYRGFRIPSGSTVLANVWHITHDPKIYPEPFAFNPDRYLGDTVGSSVNPDPKGFIFGFSRRECPGRFVADASVWLMVATTLATFNIGMATDENGQPLVPDVKYSSGILRRVRRLHPLSFPCKIVPKSPRAAALVG
ncbi:cytochrome P450 [Exidia glandulosa HHB12029]|uniref:Cytochrome P450 n=1 Tax=Exidia glandulosa HHB12029 TaxID=1314781 RepID=A0A165BLD3_EXIGL|nr:cytochrome P450 [Exidia glandulosa HHB12029]